MTGNEGGKPDQKPGSNPGRTGVTAGEMAGAGIQFAIFLVVFSLSGVWLDKQLGTSPWLVIVMVFLGAAAAFYSLYHKLMKGQRLGDRRVHSERRDDRE